MDKILINLLPSDILLLEKDRNRRSFAIRLAILILIIMVIITALLLFARFAQNLQLQKTQTQFKTAEDSVNQYQNQEESVFFLKDRLQDISSLSNKQSPYVESYKLLTNLTPGGITYSSISIDKPKIIIVIVLAVNSDSARQFFNNLTDPGTNQDKISKVNIDSFSLDQNGSYLIDLTITET